MMLDTIGKQLGAGFVVPALAVLIMAWLAKLLSDFHTSSRQSRRDFLDVWRSVERDDDLALEVSTRHLLGTYLPAGVIRAILRLPFPTQKLTRLATIWPHLRFDESRRQLVPARLALRTQGGCRKSAGGYLLGYFLLAMAGAYSLHFASKLPPGNLITWMLVIAAIGSVVAAFGSLARSDSLNDLSKWGLELVEELNAAMVVADAAYPAVQDGVTRDRALHSAVN